MENDNTQPSYLSGSDVDLTIVLPNTSHGPMAEVKDFEIGDIIKNRFVLNKHLGAGGMGNVYKALDLIQKEAKEKNPWIAIKLLNVVELSSLDALICLQRETSKARSLSHPNIITVYDIDRDAGLVFMTMEYIEGISLEKWIEEHVPASVEQCLPIWQAVASALDYSHKKGLVHCDLKPGNIIISNTGEVKVIDFGIARAKADAGMIDTVFNLNEMGALTPAYASCEMIEGLPPEPSDDIFALAIVMYRMLTGEHPYPGKTATQARALGIVAPAIKVGAKTVWPMLKAGLSYDRANRPKYASDLVKFNTDHKKRFDKLVLTGGVIAVSVISIVVGILTLQFMTPKQQPLQSTAGLEVEQNVIPISPQLAEEIEQRLLIADSHLLMEKYVRPVGANAAEAYQYILSLDPNNQRAKEGLDIIASYFAEQARAYLSNNDIERATSSVIQGLKIEPNHPQLLQLKQQLL
jgi:serine/threonine protein kinase